MYIHDDTPCITESAARKENLEGGAGQCMREVLCKHGMAATSAILNPSDTYVGNKHQSLIDLLCLPLPLVDTATGGGPLEKMGRRLMLANVTSYFDHYPVHI